MVVDIGILHILQAAGLDEIGQANGIGRREHVAKSATLSRGVTRMVQAMRCGTEPWPDRCARCRFI
jgi:hypothetical protein